MLLNLTNSLSLAWTHILTETGPSDPWVPTCEGSRGKALVILRTTLIKTLSEAAVDDVDVIRLQRPRRRAINQIDPARTGGVRGRGVEPVGFEGVN